MLADRRIAEAAGGRGGLVFLAGEAGIGKTRLLGSVDRRAQRAGFSVARAAAFTGDAVASGGVLLDLASDLRRSALPGLQRAGETMTARLHEPVDPGADPHRVRRLLVQDLVDAVADVPDGNRLLVLLEDLHWADELSLEVLALLAPRLQRRSVLVVGAYRTDELFDATPMRRFRSQLVAQRLAEEVRLARLTAKETAVLVSSVLGRAADLRAVAALHDRSDGIPLHVEELLAAATSASGGQLTGELTSTRVPETLADAVVARAEGLDEQTRAVAAAASVIGRSFAVDLLTDVTELDPDTVDTSLRQLRRLHLVQEGDGTSTYDFRHALIRDAIYADVPANARRRLHAQVAAAAQRRGFPDGYVSKHFDEAGHQPAAYAHALAAAADAAALSAHREALELYRRAERNQRAEAPLDERARLQSSIGDECLAVDDNAAAVEAYEAAHALWLSAGDPVAAADVVPRLVAASHLLGADLEHRSERLRSALDLVGEAAAPAVRGRLLSGLAAAYMLDRRLDESIAYGERSRAALRAAAGTEADDLEDIDLDVAATLGSVLVFAGRLDEGWALLEDAVDRGVRGGREAAAARSYRMLASSASVLVEYDRAQGFLTPGIAYADSVELWNHRSYLGAHLAHVRWARGEWDSAEETAHRMLADGRGGITTRITATYTLGYVALGRGQWDRAAELLGEALVDGEAMRELQRVSPPLWGLAESTLLRGDNETTVALTERGRELSAEVSDAAYLFPFVLTGTRARLGLGDLDAARAWVAATTTVLEHRGIPGTLPALTHAGALVDLAAGDLAAARAGLAAARAAWTERHRFWEGSWAALDLARAAAAARRLGETQTLAGAVHAAATAVSAAPLVTAAEELLALARGGRPAQPWHPLTEREFEVARLVAGGLTNRQIAEQLVLSPKTISAHVEHILTKLGAGRRAEIAAWTAKVQA
jgi:DNA-binding CsgD family transcriptional regulator/tetratricopeptide (TPR) repeat protein